jgi:SAM-dependent methyltransferase
MNREPACFEILLTRLVFLLFGRFIYEDFADRLPISGSERVLDFGCGMGTAAYYVAEKLTHGQLTCLDISERWLNACRKTLHSFGNITFLRSRASSPDIGSFDLAYCHFVLHDIPDHELERVIPALADSLKSGGMFVFREPLKNPKKLRTIKGLAEQSGLSLKDSRVTDIPLTGNALESVYVKKESIIFMPFMV